MADARIPFAFDPRYRIAARAFGVSPDTAYLELDDDPAPVGRHSRQEAPASDAAPRPSRALPPRGKHAGTRRSPAPARRTSVPADEMKM